jgi:hypothetical protein
MTLYFVAGVHTAKRNMWERFGETRDFIGREAHVSVSKQQFNFPRATNEALNSILLLDVLKF